MLKLTLIAVSALALGGAAPIGELDNGADRIGPHGPAAAALDAPFAALCVAGLELALGGETGPVRIGLTQTAGRCGCPEGCSLASLHLNMAGVTLRL